jgi:DNA-binding LacI/PurR family transcriptional regulator/signal transduction histidine kinase
MLKAHGDWMPLGGADEAEPMSELMVPRASQPLARAPTFGVLADWLEGEYQGAVVGGVVEAARESGVNLVLFTSCMLRAPFRFGERHNVVYDLARSEGIDALVILAGTLGNHLGLDDLARYCERYRPRPMSSIAAEIEGMTGILVDGEQALREGIRHLVEDHKYRRIAFVGGPEGNNEARDRLRTYGEVLTAYGLMPPDSFVVHGDFQYESGVDAVHVLLDERGATFDAIVAANDQMALGVIDALRVRNIRVPRDVAIIGFDDISEARYCAPPLTTIRQPLRQEGRLAVEVLLQRLRGERVDDVLVLPTELVVRRSCGCYSDARRVSLTSNLTPPLPRPATELTVDDALRLRRPRILEAMREPMGGRLDGIPEGWEESLLDTLIAELRGVPAGFAERVSTLLKDMMRSDATGNPWQPVLSALRRELMPCLASDPIMRSRAEDLLQEARVLVGEAVEDAQAQHRLMIEHRTRALSEAAEILSAAFDLESLGKALRECLPRLGVPSAYLVLDEDISSAGARVVFAHDPGRDPAALEQIREAPIEGTSMPDGLLPVDRTYAMVVEQLFFKDDPLGYAVFEMGPTEAFTYEALRVRISGALKVALLIEELQVRAGQLQEAYGALQDNQQRLLSAEKMATLGRITANIAHEMNTPLAAVRAALVEIDKRAVEYEASVGHAEVTPDDYRQIAVEMGTAIKLAKSASERAAGFVRGIKTQTRDLAPQEKLRFDPVPVIEDSLLLLSYDIRRSSGEVRFDPPQRPIELLGTPGRLAQIVTNLVTNALEALPDVGEGSVTLTLTSDDHFARLVVQDTGSGIAPEIRDKVFEPMFTTKPLGQGTGLGLAIVKDLVGGYFGGSVDLASEPGRGTTFTLTFPLAGGN